MTVSGIRTNKCIKYGFNVMQGYGFSEKSSSYCYPEARVPGINIVDTNDQVHHLIMDYRTGRFYDISMYDGPTGLNITKYYKDKVNVSGSGGTDLTPKVGFKEDTGESESFFIRNPKIFLGLRPQNEANRNATGYDSNGYPSGIEFDMSVYVDGNPTTSSVTAENISMPKHEIIFDRNVEANRIQAELVANKSGFRVVKEETKYVVYDKPKDPDSRKMNEDTWQLNLASDLSCWLTRGGTALKDKATGETYSGTATQITGPDSKDNSALVLSTTVTLNNDAITNGTVLLWYYGTYGNPTGITLTTYNTSGGWTLAYCHGAIPADLVLPTGTLYDVRVYSSTKTTNDIAYLYNDLVYNSGNNTLPVF